MSGKNNFPEKKQPMRKCLGCMESFEKRSLIRVVRTPENGICLDFKGKVSGRGAYVCKSLACFRKARKASRFERNLECQIPDEVYQALEKELTENG